MDKMAIIKNFSRYAHTYDSYADIQKRAAVELLGFINHNGLRNILEIGCGTGNYTILLRNKFSKAKLQAMDISAKMIEVAAVKFKKDEVEFSVADAEKENLEANYDLITSNACFQWFDDLRAALKRYRDAVNNRGIIAFSIFGSQTFKELNESLNSLGLSGNGANFISQDKLKSILEENFKEAQITECSYEESFSSLSGLLEKIKYTGIRGDAGKNKIIFTRGILKRIESCYLDKFRKIKATYHIFYCRGEK